MREMGRSSSGKVSIVGKLMKLARGGGVLDAVRQFGL